MSKFLVQIFSMIKHEGQNYAEYGFIFALVSVVTMVVLKTIGN